MKRALADIDGSLLAIAAGVLQDAGLKVVGSEFSPSEHGVVRLLIEGEQLPFECATERHIVDLEFTQETYGSQRLTRLTKISIRR